MAVTRKSIKTKRQLTSEDIHRVLFPRGAPKHRTIDEMKEGIRRHFRKLYPRP